LASPAPAPAPVAAFTLRWSLEGDDFYFQMDEGHWQAVLRTWKPQAVYSAWGTVRPDQLTALLRDLEGFGVWEHPERDREGWDRPGPWVALHVEHNGRSLTTQNLLGGSYAGQKLAEVLSASFAPAMKGLKARKERREPPSGIFERPEDWPLSPLPPS